MTDKHQGGALAVVGDAGDAPTLSAALGRWLEKETSARPEISPLGQVADWWADYDQSGQGEMAFRVRRGFRLNQIRAASDRDFVEGLKRRDTSVTVAYELMDTYKLFVAFPSLVLMDRAATLGFARIRELKPHLGIDGIRALIEGKEVDTLTYDAAVAMTKREIVAWRKARFTALLEHEQAQRPVDVPDFSAEKIKPRALEVATDELLGASHRAQLELDRAKAVVTALLPPGLDSWKPDRVELAHATRLVLHAIIEQAQALDADLHTRFGAASVAPLAGEEYHTLPFSRIVASGKLVEQQAELNTLQRAVGRQKRLKWRGAPPKTLEAVIAQALNADHE